MASDTKQNRAELFANQACKSCTSDNCNPCDSSIILTYTLCLGIIATAATIATLFVHYVF